MQPILVRVGKKVATENSSPYGGNPFNIYLKMYVIVEINGQQFKAEEGKKLFVHHIQNAETVQLLNLTKSCWLTTTVL